MMSANARCCSLCSFRPHWVAMLQDDLPVLLASDQAGYDAF